ncbi:hypothetical protein ACPPVS_07425 [Cellulomonas sp. McL0617]|uniref:hypothetical protein n=1 Tax=Cellulomonas sp. McL0617 TaxID=3415675 RepID=UPI003CFAA8FD
MMSYGGEPMTPGLGDFQLDDIERRFGFRFEAVHRDFLRFGVPTGRYWANWRDGAARTLRARLRVPVDGVVADVLEHDFWPADWGIRPDVDEQREAVARGQLANVPTLVPLFAQCYVPAGDRRARCPVFLVDRTTVSVVGRDLYDYAGRVFAAQDPGTSRRPLRIPFWSDLAELFDPDRRGPGIMDPARSPGTR